MNRSEPNTATPGADSLVARALLDIGAWRNTFPAFPLVVDPSDPAFLTMTNRTERPDIHVLLTAPAGKGYESLSDPEKQSLAAYLQQALASVGWKEDHVVILRHPEIESCVVYGIYVSDGYILLFNIFS